MTLSLSQKIQAIYPQLQTIDDWQNIRLQNDGAGDYIAAWNHPTIPQPTEAELAGVDETAYRNQQAFKALRARRNQFLAETDWVTLQALDKSIDGFGIQLPQVWMDYRQALRDLPANTVDPANPVWPTKPGGAS